MLPKSGGGREATGRWWVEARDTAKHPTMPRSVPHSRELSCPSVTSPGGQKSGLGTTMRMDWRGQIRETVHRAWAEGLRVCARTVPRVLGELAPSLPGFPSLWGSCVPRESRTKGPQEPTPHPSRLWAQQRAAQPLMQFGAAGERWHCTFFKSQTQVWFFRLKK